MASGYGALGFLHNAAGERATPWTQLGTSRTIACVVFPMGFLLDEMFILNTDGSPPAGRTRNHPDRSSVSAWMAAFMREGERS